MPSSPRTPRHSRAPSAIDISLTSPSPGSSSSNRRHSKASLRSPTTPSRGTLARSDSIGVDVFSNGVQPENGLGNLADELADVWDDDEEDGEEPDLNFHESGTEAENGEVQEVRDSGADAKMSSPNQKDEKLAAPNGTARGHRRKGSEYDGSDYGEDSDVEDSGMPSSLVARMDAVEGLVRRGTESNGTDSDGVVTRVVEHLKDLGGQSGVEGHATRLITAHTALSTHLLHQTRLLHSLTYPLFSPLTLPPSEETVDEILPLLLTISESMPRPSSQALTSLSTLHGVTADLIQSLSYLSDTLHMSRQTTTTATRRLKSARELVAELRKEEEEKEEAERFLRRGNWSERLGRRECAGVCGDVVGGFEEVCEGWRKRLMAQAEAVGA